MVQNFAHNSSFEVGLEGTWEDFGVGSLSRRNFGSAIGEWHAVLTGTGSGNPNMQTHEDARIPVSVGEEWFASTYLMWEAGLTPKEVHIDMRWFDINGNSISSDIGGGFTPSETAWLRILNNNNIAPINAAFLGIRIVVVGIELNDELGIDAILIGRGDPTVSPEWTPGPGDPRPLVVATGGEWGALLDDVYISGGDSTQFQNIQTTQACSGLSTDEIIGCLTEPPAGLDVPELRTEDVEFPQRDGAKHFRDWYLPRIVTLTGALTEESCPQCPTVAEQKQKIMHAWSRRCDDTELVIYTDCHGTDTEAATGQGLGSPIVGPFGIVGRPRVAQAPWRPGRKKIADLTLRFDAVDHKMFILDPCGTPGSGTQCVEITPSITSACRTYPRCYDDQGTWCYDVEQGETGNEANATNIGTLCACLTITLHGQLTEPTIENVTTGESFTYETTIVQGSAPVIIDGSEGTATQGGAPRTHFLVGTFPFCLDPDVNHLRMTSFGATDNGSAEICWRNAVLSA